MFLGYHWEFEVKLIFIDLPVLEYIPHRLSDKIGGILHLQLINLLITENKNKFALSLY